ncbi:MAG: (2Fe-2S)-binding protein [Actinomycetes bacterium]|jgi:carbon-monoxide dehydrogenase small subunit
MQVTITVNGVEYTRDVEPRMLLVHFIRDDLEMRGTHWGCDTSNCGACTLWVNGEPVKSCTMLAVMADGASVSTVESLAKGGQLDPIQKGFQECHGLQCGYCTPGMMMTGRWLVDQNPQITREEIREGISGNICRCTGYKNILDAIEYAAANPATSEVTA